MMLGSEFLEVARTAATGTTEGYWRAGVVHAYYALILECRDALTRWSFPVPRRENMHAWVRLRFAYSADADLKIIGSALDDLVRKRNKASYDLQSNDFPSAAVAYTAISDAEDALALLARIDANPARRAAAIGSIRP